ETQPLPRPMVLPPQLSMPRAQSLPLDGFGSRRFESKNYPMSVPGLASTACLPSRAGPSRTAPSSLPQRSARMRSARLCRDRLCLSNTSRCRRRRSRGSSRPDQGKLVWLPRCRCLLRSSPASASARSRRRAHRRSSEIRGERRMGRSCFAPGGALDRAHDAHVRAAAEQIRGERLLDLAIARMRILIEQCLCLHDHAVDAVAALHGLLINEGLLQPVRMLGAAQALERRDLRVTDTADRIKARAYCLAVDMNRARAALREAASEARAAQSKLVTQRIEEWHLRIVDRDLRSFAVDVQFEFHGSTWATSRTTQSSTRWVAE